jgi:hypothetical protein
MPGYYLLEKEMEKSPKRGIGPGISAGRWLAIRQTAAGMQLECIDTGYFSLRGWG